jgi:hypothetical protein
MPNLPHPPFCEPRATETRRSRSTLDPETTSRMNHIEAVALGVCIGFVLGTILILALTTLHK